MKAAVETLESRRYLAADLSSVAAGLTLNDAELVRHDAVQFVRNEGVRDVYRVAQAGRAVDVAGGRFSLTLNGLSGTREQQMTQAQRRLNVAKVDAQVTDWLGDTGQVTITTGKVLSPAKASRALARVSGVTVIEPEVMGQLDFVPTDTNFNTMWGLNQTSDFDIDAPEAWDISTGDNSLIVAVFDSGIQLNHPDLAANIWSNPLEIPGNGVDDDGNGFVDDVNGWDFWSNDNNVNDGIGHGTHVAGTIGAVGDNNLGVTGVAMNVKILPIKIGSDSSTSVSSFAATQGINYVNALIDRGYNIRVGNHSWGGGGSESSSLRNAMNNSRLRGMMYAVAAGNDGTNNDSSAHWPSNTTLENVLSVASVEKNGTLSGFSNYGTSTVDIAAPGGAILSTVPGSRYAQYFGTSMASPHVAGAMALALMVNPNVDVSTMRAAVLDSAVDYSFLSSKVASGGLLNVRNLLAAVSGPLPPITPSAPTLLIADDSGSIATDRLTNVTRPRFTGTAQAGITVKIMDGTTVLGTGAANSIGEYSVQPDTDLLDGDYSISALTSNSIGDSTASSSIAVTIDTVGPEASNFLFNYQTTPHTVTFDFSENVYNSFSVVDIRTDRATGGTASGGANYNAVSGTTTINYGTTLANGRYTLNVLAAGLEDLAGNPPAADQGFNFLFQMGDANNDGNVDVTDLGILSSNFRSAGNYAAGDFNYDGTVDVTDLGILSSNFRTSLPMAVASVESTTPITRGIFSTTPIDDKSVSRSVLG